MLPVDILSFSQIGNTILSLSECFPTVRGGFVARYALALHDGSIDYIYHDGVRQLDLKSFYKTKYRVAIFDTWPLGEWSLGCDLSQCLFLFVVGCASSPSIQSSVSHSFGPSLLVRIHLRSHPHQLHTRLRFPCTVPARYCLLRSLRFLRFIPTLEPTNADRTPLPES